MSDLREQERILKEALELYQRGAVEAYENLEKQSGVQISPAFHNRIREEIQRHGRGFSIPIPKSIRKLAIVACVGVIVVAAALQVNGKFLQKSTTTEEPAAMKMEAATQSAPTESALTEDRKAEEKESTEAQPPSEEKQKSQGEYESIEERAMANGPFYIHTNESIYPAGIEHIGLYLHNQTGEELVTDDSYTLSQQVGSEYVQLTPVSQEALEVRIPSGAIRHLELNLIDRYGTSLEPGSYKLEKEMQGNFEETTFIVE